MDRFPNTFWSGTPPYEWRKCVEFRKIKRDITFLDASQMTEVQLVQRLKLATKGCTVAQFALLLSSDWFKWLIRSCRSSRFDQSNTSNVRPYQEQILNYVQYGGRKMDVLVPIITDYKHSEDHPLAIYNTILKSEWFSNLRED